MKLIKLQIRNFRNLKKIEYDPLSGLNILIGDNAQGKTNLLESVFLLATGNSFRNATDTDLVNYESSGYAINSVYENSGRLIETNLQYKVNSSKSITVNNKKSSQNNADRLRVVLFTPDDLFLIKGAPAKRRAFLDFILKQVSADYLFNLDNYYAILKKRNLLLKKEQTTGKAFTIINEIFIEKAIRIILQRINFVNILEDIVRTVYMEINYIQSEIRTKYALSFTIDSDKINTDILHSALQKHIDNNLKKEVLRKKTLVGPHLDDINIYLDGRLARTFASQGQQRNMAISLKLAEIYAFKKIKGFFPVFLLDEVLAELDERKRELLIKHLQGASFQSFLTSVNFEKLSEDHAAFFIVEKGRLIRKEL